MSLTHEIAQRMIGASQAEARELGLGVSTAIVDADGRLFAFGRMDGTHWLSIDAAQAKAFKPAAENHRLALVRAVRIKKALGDI
jgi:uncharacterized protein GlcG (DUF336 family)